MRNRKDITPQYLQHLLDRIQVLADSYQKHIDTLWFQKEEKATLGSFFEKLEKVKQLLPTLADRSNPLDEDQEIHLKKVTLKELANEHSENQDSNLATYKLILNSLNECYNHSKHPEHEHMQALHALLVTELKTQREAEWHQPDEDYTEQQAISQSLHTIDDHALYASTKEKLYAEKWDVGLSALHDLKKNFRQPKDASIPVDPDRTLKWDAMCHDQWWHIQRNDRYEISLGAKFLLGLSDENKSDCFVLQDPSADIRALEQKRSHLINEQYTNTEKLKKEIAALREKKKKQHDSGKAAAINADILNLEDEKREYERDYGHQIIEITKDIETQQVELILKKNNNYPQKNALARLHDYYQELSLWTPRNVSILLMENIIDEQIHKLRLVKSKSDKTELESGQRKNDDLIATDTHLEDMIDNLSTEMENILKLVLEAREKIQHELSLLQKIIDDKHVDTHGLHPFYVSFSHINPKEAAEDFKKYAKDHLLEYSECAHFEAVKKQLRYDTVGHRGVILPRSKDILYPEETLSTAVDSPSESGSLRRSQRVLSSLNQLGTPPVPHEHSDDEDNERLRLAPTDAAPARHVAAQPQQPVRAGLSTTAKILIGIAIGTGIAIAIAGIIAGIIFSAGTGAAPAVGAALAIGGAVSAKLGTGSLIGLFSGIFAGGFLGGLFGGAIFARVTTPANIAVTQPVATIATNNAQIHNQLGVTNDLRRPQPLRQHSVPTIAIKNGKRHLFRSITSPELLASPNAQSQEMTTALARNASQH